MREAPLARDAERRLGDRIRRARLRWRRDLLRDCAALDELVRAAREAARGDLSPHLLLDIDDPDEDIARSHARVAARDLERLRGRFQALAERARTRRGDPLVRRTLERAAGRARVRAARLASSLPLTDAAFARLLERLERDGTDGGARVRAAREREAVAKRELVEANLGLVVAVAREYARRPGSLSDLVQEGSIGLMKAVDRFEPGRGVRFSAYAAWWIREAVVEARGAQGVRLRLPARVTALVGAVARASRQLAQELGREPDVEEVAGRCDLEVERVVETLGVARAVLSLDAPASPAGEATLADVVEDTSTPSIDDRVARRESRALVEDLLRALTPREERVLRARFGFDERSEPRTLEQVGADFGLSRERVRQIERRALEHMRRATNRGALEPLRKEGGSSTRVAGTSEYTNFVRPIRVSHRGSTAGRRA